MMATQTQIRDVPVTPYRKKCQSTAPNMIATMLPNSLSIPYATTNAMSGDRY